MHPMSSYFKEHVSLDGCSLGFKNRIVVLTLKMGKVIPMKTSAILDVMLDSPVEFIFLLYWYRIALHSA